MDSESCNRAFSQARVYLEQIRSRVAPGSIDIHGPGKRDYLVDAAKQIRLALERDVSEDYEEAFNHYKNGVDVLLSGVQVDPNKERREAVKRKITQYLKRAEEIFNCHLQCNLGNGNSTETGYSSLRFRPIRTLSTPVENLKRCKVVGIIDKVQIVQDPATGDTFILKSIPKSHVETRQRQTIIPHGIPFMTELLRYSVSKDSIFLHLEHVKGGNLWSYLRSHHGSASVRSPLLSSKLTSDFGYIREEEHIESFHETGSDSQQSCNIYPENNNGPMPVSVNHPLLKKMDCLMSMKHSSSHLSFRTSSEHRWHTEKAGGPWKKNLSTTHPFPGATESTSKTIPQEQNHSVSQRLTFRSCDSFMTVDGIGTTSGKETPQPEPKPQTGKRSNHSAIEVTRGYNNSKRETPWQNQLYPGTLEEDYGEKIETRGEDDTFMQRAPVLDHKHFKTQLTIGWHGSLVEPVAQSHTPLNWDINEEQIQVWAAELILALEGLHQQGILCQDLNPRNLLLDDTGHLRLTFFGQWCEVEPQYSSQAVDDLYCAPEVGGISELTEACDWWSFGALLYELLNGVSLSQNHPSGIHPYTQIYLPEKLSQSASSLLSELLQYDPKQRLGSGEKGASKIKSHIFFNLIQWNKMVAN
ncbi:ribosomal protein S6 kinase-like 1 [Crotalus tigris]|uniref:ribosomal protein S6 kinase-like 1 n=1 Tax=Crotalus tigris TaxID=88082 RepID=UPI00192F7A07|nr:ribosomal protein S6 kinase-like 1 [Crotalus tigris]XP_039207649.1 ribosomal protein S6 kinase-like 1 [Crotalus tigris]XP_039207651.1 ribosomal protein S6 kinase-like 1 [Crotalus tigris]XP_039207652.1 ribosomal protein S6 kinase-like 1 [Crotalus tigris]